MSYEASELLLEPGLADSAASADRACLLDPDAAIATATAAEPLAAESRGSTALDRLRRHPKLAAGLAALAMLTAAGAGARIKDAGEGVLPGGAEATRTIAIDLNGDGHIEASERITQTDLNQLPNPKSLPPVLAQPIQGEKRVAEELKASDAKFVGAYKSAEGEAFNFYAAAQPGEELALRQDFQVNPQTIEFILGQIRANIPNAPQNSSKQRILHNLQAIQDSDRESITNIFVDVSPTSGCLSPAHQMVQSISAACRKAGVSGGTTWHFSPDEQGVMVSAGSAAASFGEGVHSGYLDAHLGIDPQSAHRLPSLTRRNVSGQQATLEHEMVHVLSGGDSTGTYREGDPDHEVTSWLVDGHHFDKYNFDGATGPSPLLGKKIELLVKAHLLPPVVSIKK